MRRLLVCAAGLATVTLAGGCTSASSPSAGAGLPSTSASTGTSDAPSSALSPPGNSSPAPSATPSATAPTTPTPPTSAPTTPAGSTTVVGTVPLRCAPSDVSIIALRGSGAQQKQFATVVVTDTGGRTCALIGFAAVSLRRGGAALGAAAAPGTSAVTTVTLSPGQRAQALVHGASTCQADVSDTMRVSLPGQSAYVDAAVPMRGCPLIVDAFVRAG